MNQHHREISQANYGIYAESGNININHGNQPIPKNLTAPPFISKVFIGREAEIKAVRQQLQNGHLLLLVNGEGGIGKTTLTAHYYQQYAHDYQHVAWVFAESSLLEALLSLASPLQLEFAPQCSSQQRLNALLAGMANLASPCLLVIDNANNLAELNDYYLALSSCPNFHILLTTRITEFEQAARYAISPLPVELATQLFVEHYPQHQRAENPLLHSILAAVGYNTLVIELLAKNLAISNRLKTRYRLAELLADLQQKGLLAIQSQVVNTAYHSDGQALRAASPAAIISAMYDMGELNDQETALLSVFAVLPAENIDYAVLETLLPDKENLDTVLLDLAQKGWLANQADSNFKISPVVQEITLDKNRRRLLADCRQLIASLIDQLIYEPGIGHPVQISYTEAAVLTHYGEQIIQRLIEPDEYLALLCDRLGNFHKTTGNLVNALNCFEAYFRSYKALYQAYPNKVSVKNCLAISYEKLGDTHAMLGNLEQALGLFEAEILLFQELHANYSYDVSFKNGLAICYSKLGDTHTILSNLTQCLYFYKNETDLFKELYVANPNNLPFKRGLAISYEKLGNTYTALGNLNQALVFFDAYFRLSNELYEAAPDNVSFKSSLAISYEKLGTAHAALDNLNQALVFFDEYFRLSNELYEAHPNNVSLKNNLAISYEKLGTAHAALGNLALALIFFTADTQLTKELYDAYPTNVAFKRGLAISYEKLGKVHFALENWEQALDFFEEQFGLSKELYEAHPSDVSIKNGLAISYTNLGRLFERAGLNQQAKEYYQTAKLFLDELVNSSPLYVKFKQLNDWVVQRLSGL